MDTPKRRVATRSPVALARMALKVATDAVPAFSSKFSKRIFTQRQLLAILVLQQFFKTDDRGIVAILADFAGLRRVLRLKRVPHPTTLLQARRRLAKKGVLRFCRVRSSRLLASRE